MCSMWAELVFINGGKCDEMTYRTVPKSLKFMAKTSLRRSQLITLPHLFGVGIGQVRECSRDIFSWKL